MSINSEDASNVRDDLYSARIDKARAAPAPLLPPLLIAPPRVVVNVVMPNGAIKRMIVLPGTRLLTVFTGIFERSVLDVSDTQRPWNSILGVILPDGSFVPFEQALQSTVGQLGLANESVIRAVAR